MGRKVKVTCTIMVYTMVSVVHETLDFLPMSGRKLFWGSCFYCVLLLAIDW